MFFRHATPFRLAPEYAARLGDIESAFAEHALRPCGPLEQRTVGFVPALGVTGGAFTRPVGDNLFFAVGCEEKHVPAAAINAALKAKLEEQDQPVTGKARRALKLKVFDALLQRAIATPSKVMGYCNTKTGWIVLDTASLKRAEDVLTTIRNALGSFPAVPVAPRIPSIERMTAWLMGKDLPDDLLLGSECVLKDSGDGSTARFQGKPLVDGEINKFFHQSATAKRCTHLGLVFDDRIQFVLRDSLALSKMQFSDDVMNRLDEQLGDDDDPASRFDTEMLLMTDELTRLQARLAEWFALPVPGD